MRNFLSNTVKNLSDFFNEKLQEWDNYRKQAEKDKISTSINIQKIYQEFYEKIWRKR